MTKGAIVDTDDYRQRSTALQAEEKKLLSDPPNLRDYYPDRAAYDAAIEVWQETVRKLHGQREALRLGRDGRGV